MNQKLSALFLCVYLAPMTLAAKTILPDACGDDKVKFDFKADAGQAVATAPEAGKALVFFIEPKFSCVGCLHSRVGMDGNWIGATRSKSYFVIEVEPGVHHLCATGEMRKQIAMNTFTAEAGKVYYFQVNSAAVMARSQNVPGNPGFNAMFDFSILGEDEGKFMVKTSEYAVPIPK